jgi:hypothetical protein
MANKRMLEAAAQKFIEMGERGYVQRPLVTYQALKEALEAPEDTSDGPVDGPIESVYWQEHEEKQ